MSADEEYSSQGQPRSPDDRLGPDPESLTDENAASAPPEEITPDTALSWLDAVRPQAVLALLREPEAGQLAAAAFAGFRLNAAGYAHPLVRRRLAQILVRDADFREHFQFLLPQQPDETTSTLPAENRAPDDARHSPGVATPTAPVRRDRTSPEMQSAREDAHSFKTQLDQERQLRKRDRLEARVDLEQTRQSLAAARKELDTVMADLRRTIQERDALSKALADASARIAREGRRGARLRIERDILLKESKSANSAAVNGGDASELAPETKPPSAQLSDPASAAFEIAVRQLRAKGDASIAMAVVHEVLRLDPRNIDALEIASAAYRDSGRWDRSAMAGRDSVTAALDRGDIRRATESLVGLLTMHPDTPLLDTIARPYVAGLRSASPSDLDDMARRFAVLRAAGPVAYARVSGIITEFAVPATAASLFPAEPLLGPADPLPFDSAEPVTANALLAAVDANNTTLVDMARASLARLRDAVVPQYDRAIAALSAAGGDETYLRPLLNQPHGPIVVDASNVAWHDESREMGDRPRLRQILQMRATLRMRGFFPVRLITDAPLPFTIDDRAGLRKLIARNEITIVDTGIDADEVLIRESKRLRAPMVTNDYMADWDPDGEIEKIRYTISTGGTVYLLS